MLQLRAVSAGVQRKSLVAHEDLWLKLMLDLFWICSPFVVLARLEGVLSNKITSDTLGT